jgi:hypothetical protein
LDYFAYLPASLVLVPANLLELNLPSVVIRLVAGNQLDAYLDFDPSTKVNLVEQIQAESFIAAGKRLDPTTVVTSVEVVLATPKDVTRFDLGLAFKNIDYNCNFITLMCKNKI